MGLAKITSHQEKYKLQDRPEFAEIYKKLYRCTSFQYFLTNMKNKSASFTYNALKRVSTIWSG
jgi:hypothetical protein